MQATAKDYSHLVRKSVRTDKEDNMATRPIFIPEVTNLGLVRVENVNFTWHAGMAKSQKQMSMRSLHAAAQNLYPKARILEVSRMSDQSLGAQLSAFNLTFKPDGYANVVSVECAFQASKIFERGGPYLDLLAASPADAKGDPRLKESGRLIGFRFLDEDWSNKPPTAFYDWIYINALSQKPSLCEGVLNYDIFTDIAFNPEKSINCQAGAVALYVALERRKEFDAVIKSKQDFLKVEASAFNKVCATDGQGQLI